MKRVPLGPNPSSEPEKLSSSGGLKITGYSSPDGVFHAFHGKARWVGAGRDSLELQGRRDVAVPNAEPSGDTPDKKDVTIRLAKADVTSLLYRAPDGGKTGILGLGIVSTMLVAGTVLLIVLFAASGD